jgi:hypothetical protein
MARIRLIADQIHPPVSYRLVEEIRESGFLCRPFGRLSGIWRDLPAVVDGDEEGFHH